MTSFGGGLGDAEGRVSVDLSGLRNSVNQVVTFSRQMDTALAGIGTKGTANINRFNQVLNTTQQRLKAVRGQLVAVSVAGTALTGLGLKAADNIKLLEARFRALAGSEEAAKQLMDQIAKGAQAAGLPVRQMQRDFAGLVPAVRAVNGDIDTYINLVARLSTLNPAEGTTGAVFAIREALSSGGTDLISLTERFNLTKSTLRELIADTGDFAQALDVALTEQGITAEVAEASIDSLGGAVTRFRDAVNQAFEAGFKPFLNDATGLVNTLTTALSGTPSIILKIAGGFTIAATSVATLALGLEKAIRLTKTLRESGALGRVGRIGGIGAAAFGGAQAGAFIARQINPELGSQQDALRLLGERMKQIVVIITKGLELGASAIVSGIQKLAEIFLTARIIVRNALDNLGETIKGIARFVLGAFETMIGELIGLFAGLLESVVDALDDLPLISGGAFRGGATGLRNIATDIGGRGSGRASEAALQIGQLLGPTAEETEAIANQLENTFGGVKTSIDGMTESMYDLLFPAQEVEESVDPAAQAIQNIANRFKTMVNNVRQFREIQREVLSELAEEQARIDEERAIDRARDERDTALAQMEALEDFHRGRARSDEEFYRNQQKQINDYQDDLADAITEREKSILKIRNDYAEQNAEAAIDHQEKLFRITRDGRESILDAASRLDARGVAQALRTTQIRLSDEQRDYDKARDARQKEMNQRLTELDQNYTEQRQQRMAAFEQQLNDQQEQYDRRRQQEQDDFDFRFEREQKHRALRLQDQQEDFAREDALRQQEAQKRINQMLQEANLQRSILGNMLSAWSSGLSGLANTATGIVSTLNSMFSRLSGTNVGRSVANTGRSLISGIGTAIQSIGSNTSPFSAISERAGIRTRRGFAAVRRQYGGSFTAGQSLLVGEVGPELVRFNSGGSVIPNAALAGGGGVNLGGVSINFNGPIGANAAEIETRVYNALDKIITDGENGRGRGIR